MGVITTGAKFSPMIVYLAMGSRYRQSFTYMPNGVVGNWPASSSGYMKVSYTAAGSASPTFAATWPATFAGQYMTIDQPSSVTDLVPSGSTFEIYGNLNDGLGDQPMYSGMVVRST